MQPLSGDQLLSQSDIPVLCKLRWAIGVVFGLVLLAICRSRMNWPYVIELVDGGVFGIDGEIGQSLPSQSACALGVAGGQSFDYLVRCWQP